MAEAPPETPETTPETPPRKAPRQRPKLMIRRGKKVTEGVEVQIVFADIKAGKLKPSHEFSMDGANWRRLDAHPQLAKVFTQIPMGAAPRSSRKGLVFFLFLVLVVAGAGLYFHPYFAFYKVQTAVDSRNIEKLAQWVDYSALHRDTKSQIDGQWNEISTKSLSGSPQAKAAVPEGRVQVDKMVNALVTPEAVMDFSKGKTDLIVSWASETSPKDQAPDSVPAPDPLADLELNMDSVNKVWESVEGVLAQAEFSYQDMNVFVATVKADNGETFQFKYQRNGMDWKLGGILLPRKPVGSSLNGIAQTALKEAEAKVRAAPKRKKKSKSNNAGEKKQAQVAKIIQTKRAYLANLELKSLAVGRGDKYQFGSPNPGIFATLINKGNRTLKEVEITIYFYNSKGAIASEKKLYPVSVSKYRPGRDNDPLGPKKKKQIGYLVKEFAPPTWAGKIQMKVTNIVLKG